MLSKRKLFNSILPEQKVVDHLDALRLGYLAKRKDRVTLAKKYSPNDRYDRNDNYREITRVRGSLRSEVATRRREESPHPFNREGKFLFKASEWKAVPRFFPGSPPEVAIIGRSNVGKSTLLNALLSLEESPLIKALVSEKPGETRHLQFYCVGRSEVPVSTAAGEISQTGPALVFTDMPGFGFAYMTQEDLLRTQEITKSYLTKRGNNLKRVLLLLDARHGLKIGDEKFFRELFATTVSSLNGERKEAREQYVYPGDKGSQVKWKLQIILTKCDLVERFELARRIQVLKEKMREILPRVGYTSLPILAISSLENRGIMELKKELASLVVKKSIVPNENNINSNNNIDNNVEKLFIEHENHESNKERITKKATRSWMPLEKKGPSDDLDRSFMVKGGTVDQALALKDATRHKQPAGKGSWVSSRKQENTVNDKNDKTMKGVLTDLGVNDMREETTIGGFMNQNTSPTSSSTTSTSTFVPDDNQPPLSSSQKVTTHTVRSRSNVKSDIVPSFPDSISPSTSSSPSSSSSSPSTSSPSSSSSTSSSPSSTSSSPSSPSSSSSSSSYCGKSQRDMEDAAFNDAFPSLSSSGMEGLKFDDSEYDILRYDGQEDSDEMVFEKQVKNEISQTRKSPKINKNEDDLSVKQDNDKAKDKIKNTGLGGFIKRDVQSIGISNQTRLNLINSGAPQTYIRSTSVPYVPDAPYLPLKSDLPINPSWNPRNWVANKVLTPQELDKKDSDRHGMMQGKGAWVSYRTTSEPITVVTPDKRKMILKGLGSGNLEKQYSERKKLLPLDDMTIQEKIKFKEHSVAQLKKNRKVSIQRLARREKRDIQFGRKLSGESSSDFNEDTFNDDNINYNNDDNNDFEAKNNGKKIEKPYERKEKKIEKGEDEKLKKNENLNKKETFKKPKSFSKTKSDDDVTRKRTKKEIRYSESFRDKKINTNEYSKTTNYSMEIKKSKLNPLKPYVHHKDDMSYNDKNEKKVDTRRPKTKYGKLVGSKINVKRAYIDRSNTEFNRNKSNNKSDKYGNNMSNESGNANSNDQASNNTKPNRSRDGDEGISKSSRDERSKSNDSDSVRSASARMEKTIKNGINTPEPKIYAKSTGRSIGKAVGRKSPFTRQPLKKR